MADDDEDVVFENSALYAHLQNVGYDNQEIEPQVRGSVIIQEPVEDRDLRPRNSFARGFMDHLRASCLAWLGIGIEWTQQQQELEKALGDKVCEAALEKDALEPEDAEFLQNVASVQSPDEERGSASSSKNSRYGIERLLSVGVGVTAYTAARLFYPKIKAFIFTYDVIVGLFGTLLVLPPIIWLLRLWSCNRQHKRTFTAFKHMLDAAEKWRKTVRHCVRLIQEMELVARGFTLVSKTSSADRLENSQLLEAQRQCPELRRLLLLTCRDLMVQMRNSTNDLIQAWPLGAEMETMYLCRVSLEDYGPIITETDEEMLQSSTDYYNLTTLKAVIEICNLQLSEFIKRSVLMCLVLPPEGAKSAVEILEQNLPSVTSKITLATSPLLASYNVHRCGLLMSSDSGSQSSYKKENVLRSHLTNVFTAVHSLDLHLQAALKRVRVLGDELEGLCGQGDSSFNSEYKEKLSHELEKIKADLDTCVDCWDESIVYIGKSNRASKNTNKEESNRNERVEKESIKQDPIALFEMGDPIIPDQVFEAYTDEDALDATHWGEDDFLTPEELQKKKKEKREALRLLKELKTVIAVRAKDWDEREQKARLRMAPAEKPADSTQPLTDFSSSVEAFKQTSSETTRATHNDRDGGRRSNSSEGSGDTDQQEMVQQDCRHTCDDTEENNTDELIDDLHEDLVTLAKDSQQSGVYESRSDDEDIFRDVADLSEDDEHDPDRMDPQNVEEEEEDSATRLANLKEKLSQEPGGGLGFAASAVAALAVQRSQTFNQMEGQTFGDSDSDDEGVIEG